MSVEIQVLFILKLEPVGYDTEKSLTLRKHGAVQK